MARISWLQVNSAHFALNYWTHFSHLLDFELLNVFFTRKGAKCSSKGRNSLHYRVFDNIHNWRVYLKSLIEFAVHRRRLRGDPKAAYKMFSGGLDLDPSQCARVERSSSVNSFSARRGRNCLLKWYPVLLSPPPSPSPMTLSPFTLFPSILSQLLIHCHS